MRGHKNLMPWVLILLQLKSCISGENICQVQVQPRMYTKVGKVADSSILSSFIFAWCKQKSRVVEIRLNAGVVMTLVKLGLRP